MMARAVRANRVWTYRFQAAIVLPLAALLGVLPVNVAARAGGWLGRIILPRPDGLERALPELRAFLPDLGEAAARQVFRGMGESFGAGFGEALHCDAFAGPDNPRLHLVGVNHVRAAQALDSGVLFIGGHFSNRDLFEIALTTLGLSGARVLQPARNPYMVEAMALRGYAFGLDEQIVPGDGAFARARIVLRAGRVVQMLSDMDAPKRSGAGDLVQAMTSSSAAARLARETGAPIVLMRMRRLGPARLEITFQPPRRFEYDDIDAEIVAWISAFFVDEARTASAQRLWGKPRWSDVLSDVGPVALTPPPKEGQ